MIIETQQTIHPSNSRKSKVAMEEDGGDKGESKQIQPGMAALTLLPNPIANAISLVTRSSSLYLRLGTFIGGLALDGARITTLTGLELSRAFIEGIFNRSGRDVAIRSTGELGKAEAEGLLERSIVTLHSTITNVSFVVSTGFHFSAAALESAGDWNACIPFVCDQLCSRDLCSK